MSDKIKGLTDWSKFQELLAQKQKKTITVDEQALFEHLKTRVKGQDAILKDVSKLIALQMAKDSTDRPIATMVFLGPTGTGKTELAKALAEFLYDDEKNMLRFDCSEFTGSESKSRLIGIPTGYVGAESGGQLTRPMFSNPRRLILFDEIEKADPSIFDLFLQLMGEGRLTEQGSGKLADFTKSIIILTSNAHAEQIGQLKKSESDHYSLINAVKTHLAENNVFRAEILGRIDRVHVFDALPREVVAEVALIKIIKLAKQYGLEVDFVAPELLLKTLLENDKVSRFGVRELERIIFELFAEPMAKARQAGAPRVTFEVNDASELTCVPVGTSTEVAAAAGKAIAMERLSVVKKKAG